MGNETFYLDGLSCTYVFCARSRPTNKRDAEQKHTTKKVARFIISLALSVMQGPFSSDSTFQFQTI